MTTGIIAYCIFSVLFGLVAWAIVRGGSEHDGGATYGAAEGASPDRLEER